MLVLFETASGFGLFKLLKDKKLKSAESVNQLISSQKSMRKELQLLAFHKFSSTAESLEANATLIEGKMSDPLKKFLEESVIQKEITEQLAVADSKIVPSIKADLAINCLYNDKVDILMRGIRTHMFDLIADLKPEDVEAAQLGLSHSLSRYTLKFSADKVDTMIVQAVSLLDDIDKELNIYCMRLREWYGWHFPELGVIVADHAMYARVVKALRARKTAPTANFGMLEDELATRVRDAAQISMGTEITEADMTSIVSLCDQVIDLAAYKTTLSDYLVSRMRAVAPNLSVLVGELVGARLISHAGSVLSLAKFPASTLQILGAEKALFRALKTRHDTPKYGLIFNAALVSQAAAKNKGKVSRVLAAKASLCARVDALADDTPTNDLGVDCLRKVEARIHTMEGNAPIRGVEGAQARPVQPIVDSKPSASYDDSQDVEMEAVGKRKADREEKVEKKAREETEEEKKARKKAKKEAKKEAEKAAAEAAGSEETEEERKARKKAKKEAKKAKKAKEAAE